LNDVVTQLVFCENGSSVDTVLVNGEVVVEGGRLTKMDEAEVLAEVSRLYDPLVPAIRKEMQDAAVMEPSLADMYFRVFG
ncbi:MAG: amidohydrolase, partial [Deltaproteobacteria bacterium]|nr:amidohydrolase [Deltaproteobacteria bacterium]